MSKNREKAGSIEVGFKEPDTAPTEGADLMQVVLAKPRTAVDTETVTENRINGIVIGTLQHIDDEGHSLVHYPGIPGDQPLIAISTEPMNSAAGGAEVALGFVNGDPVKPIILGLIHKTVAPDSQVTADQDKTSEVDVHLDGEKLTLSADREITLKCGKSSITLTRAGKVIVKGAYISNYSTGVNRIKGGSVQIN